MKFGCKDKLGAKSPPEGDGVCELVQLLLCNFCFLGCPEVSSYHLQRGQGKVQGQQTLQFLFHPLPLQGFPGDGGRRPCSEVSFSQRAFLSGECTGLRAHLATHQVGLPSICMCGMFYTLPGLKKKSSWAMPFSLAWGRY